VSERRRSLFVLLIVVALIGGSIAVVLTKPTVLGLDLKGGVQLVYHAEPTAAQPVVDPDAMQRSIDLMQQRVNAFGVSEAEILQSSTDQIEVNLPGVTDAEAAAKQVGSTAQLFFYDWEANILDDKCKTNPDQNANNRQPVVGLRTAVTQAAKCQNVGVGKGSDPLGDNSPGGQSQAAAKPRFYVFDKKTKKPFDNNAQSYDTREQALQSLDESDRANAEVIEVPAGVLVLRAESTTDNKGNTVKPDRWWVIQDRPGLSGTDIKNPQQSSDTNLGNEPIVTFNFTNKGRKAFQAITRRVAQRGADNALGQDPISTSQHFAIALDNELVSAPYINWRENPDGPRRTWRRSSRSAPCR
jgi:SecD/SecF fusion protein